MEIWPLWPLICNRQSHRDLSLSQPSPLASPRFCWVPVTRTRKEKGEEREYHLQVTIRKEGMAETQPTAPVSLLTLSRMLRLTLFWNEQTYPKTGDFPLRSSDRHPRIIEYPSDPSSNQGRCQTQVAHNRL